MTYQIDVPIYKCSVIVLTATTEREFDSFYYKNVKAMTNDECDSIRESLRNVGDASAWTQYLESGDVVVWFSNPWRDGDVVHELYHATNCILTHRGVEHTKDDEPFAYLLGYLVNEYWLLVDKYETKRK